VTSPNEIRGIFKKNRGEIQGKGNQRLKRGGKTKEVVPKKKIREARFQGGE